MSLNIKKARLAASDNISKLTKNNEKLLRTFNGRPSKDINNSDYDNIDYDNNITADNYLTNEYLDPSYKQTNKQSNTSGKENSAGKSTKTSEKYTISQNNDNIPTNSLNKDQYPAWELQERTKIAKPPQNQINSLGDDYLDPNYKTDSQRRKYNEKMSNASLPMAGKATARSSHFDKTGDNNEVAQSSVQRDQYPHYESYERTKLIKPSGEQLNVLSAEYLDPNYKIEETNRKKKELKKVNEKSNLPIAGKATVRTTHFDKNDGDQENNQNSASKDLYPHYESYNRPESIKPSGEPLNVLSAEYLDPTYKASEKIQRTKEYDKMKRRASLPVAGKATIRSTHFDKNDGYNEIPHNSVSKDQYPHYESYERAEPIKPSGEPLNVLTAEYLDPTYKTNDKIEKLKEQERVKQRSQLPVAGKATVRSIHFDRNQDSQETPQTSVIRDQYPHYESYERAEPIKPSGEPLNVLSAEYLDPTYKTNEKLEKQKEYEKMKKRASLPVAGKASIKSNHFDQNDGNYEMPNKSILKEQYPHYESYQRTESIKPAGEPLNVLSADYLDPNYKSNELIDKQREYERMKYRTSLPIAGKATVRSTHFDNQYLDDHITHKSVYKDQYPAWDQYERTKSMKPSGDQLNVLSSDIVHNKLDEIEQKKRYLKMLSQASLPAAGRPTNRSNHFNYSSNDKEYINTNSLYKDHYPAWGVTQRTQSFKPTTEPLNVLTADYLTPHLMETENKERYNQYIKAQNQLNMPTAGKPTIRSTHFDVSTDPADYQMPLSTYKDHYPGWDATDRPFVNENRKSYEPTHVITHDIAYNDINDRLSELKHQQKLLESSNLPRAGVITKLDNDMTNLINQNDLLQNVSSEYHDKFPNWGLIDRTKSFKPYDYDSNPVTSNQQTDSWISEHQSQYQKINDNILNNSIAGKPTSKGLSAINTIQQSDDHTPKISEYRENYIQYQPADRTLPYKPIDQNDNVQVNDDSSTWISEHKQQFIQMPIVHSSSSRINDSENTLDLSNQSNKSMKNNESEYKANYNAAPINLVNNQKIIRQTNPLNLFSNNLESLSNWQSDYDANYQAKAPTENIPIAGIPSDLTVDKHTFSELLFNSTFSNNVSEYKDKYTNITAERTQPIIPLQNNFMLFNDLQSTTNLTEYKDQYKPKQVDVSDKIAGKPTVISIDNVIVKDNDNFKNGISEYKDRYIQYPHDLLTNTLDKSIVKPRDNILLQFTQPFNYISETKDRYQSSSLDLSTLPIAGKSSAEINNTSTYDHKSSTPLVKQPFIGESEYKSQYVMYDVNNALPITYNNIPRDSIVLSNGFNDVWKTEHQDKYIAISLTNDAITAGKPSLSDSGIDFKISNIPIGTTEYQEQFVQKPISFIPTAGKIGIIDHINLSSPDCPPSSVWKTEYRDNYTVKENSINTDIAGTPNHVPTRVPTFFAWRRVDGKNDNDTLTTGITEYDSSFLQYPISKQSTGRYDKNPSSIMISSLHSNDNDWQSEYDSKCQELRLRTAGLLGKDLPIAGLPSRYEKNKPVNFAWIRSDNESSEESKRSDSLTGTTEYRDQYILKSPYSKDDIKPKDLYGKSSSAYNIGMSNHIDTSKTWLTEYDDKFFDYSNVALPSTYPTIDISNEAVNEEKYDNIATSLEAESNSNDEVNQSISKSKNTQYRKKNPIEIPVADRSKSVDELKNKLELKQEKSVKPIDKVNKVIKQNPTNNYISEHQDKYTWDNSERGKKNLKSNVNTSKETSGNTLSVPNVTNTTTTPFMISESHSKYSWPSYVYDLKGNARSFAPSKSNLKDTNNNRSGSITIDSLDNKINESTIDQSDFLDNNKAIDTAIHKSESANKSTNDDSLISGRKLPSQILRRSRSLSVPNRRFQENKILFTQQNNGTNPLFIYPRYPMSSDKHFNRWTTESKANFTWKSRVDNKL